MKLIANWRDVARRAHSMWAQYLTFGALIVPEILWGEFEIETSPYLWWALALLFCLYGILGRVIDQGVDSGAHPGGWTRRIGLGVALAMVAIFLLSGMSRWSVGPNEPAGAGPVTEAQFLAVAPDFVAKWEGKRNTAYLDRIARPPVWTVCYGETRGVKAGDTYTDAECLKMLEAGLLDYRAAMHGYFTEETRQARLTPERDTAYVSLAWNVGKAGAGRSTAVRRLNAGEIAGGCDALTWWNKAGGRVVRGLVNRRAEEHALCMRGLA